MASAFDTAIATRNAAMFARFGEAISYTMHGGTAASVDAIVDRQTSSVDVGDDGTRGVRRMLVRVQTSQVTTRSVGRDVATIDGATWTLDEELGSAAGVVELVMRREDVLEKHAPGHRRPVTR